MGGTQNKTSQGNGFYNNRVSYEKYFFVRVVYLAVDIFLFVPLLAVTAISRLAPRPIDVGLGPTPSINSRYHKKSLERFGYRCETFVYYTWYFTTEFDVRLDRYCPRALGPYVSYVFSLFRYKCLYTYFTGGPLGFTTLLARCEPFLLRLAGIKTVIMPFGVDVQVLTRTRNRLMVHAYSKDYPGVRHANARTALLVDAWIHGADHIISGCDWVDFLYFWDTLMLSHFAIDTGAITIQEPRGESAEKGAVLRLIDAPNHRNLKGTDHIIKAVDELRADGVPVELAVVEGVPNAEMVDLIRDADVVVDQLVLGWYAMFALEGMALGKPVVCHVRPDFLDLYVSVGLLEPGELPLVDASVHTIKERIRELTSMPRRELREIGLRSRAFVEKHHSLEAIGSVFDRINRDLGLRPSRGAGNPR